MLDFFFSMEPGRGFGAAANIVISVLGFLAVAEMYLARLRVRAEMGRLNALGDTTKSDHDGETARSMIRSFGSSLPKRDIVGRRIEILHKLHHQGADVDPDSLAALGVAEMDRTLRFARWASTTVVLLGLGGTLIGLSMAVVSARPMLQDIVAGPEAIKAVLDTFSGLGTAFSTTLMGILWAMVTSLGLVLVRSVQGSYLQRVEEVSMVHLYPYFRTSPANAMVQSARLLGELERKLAEQLTAVVGELRFRGFALTKTVEDSLSALTKQTEDSGTNIRSEVERSMTSLQKELRDNWSELQRLTLSTNEALATLVGVPTRKLQSFIKSIEALETGTAAMQQSTDNLVDLAPKLREVITAHVDRQTDVIETSVQNVSKELPAFQTSVLRRMKKQELRLARTLTLAQRGIIDAFEQQRIQTAMLKEAASKLKEGMDASRDRGLVDTQTSERLNQAVDALTQAALKLTNHTAHAATSDQSDGRRLSDGNGTPPFSAGLTPGDGISATRAPVEQIASTGASLDPYATPAAAPSSRFWDRIGRRRR